MTTLLAPILALIVWTHFVWLCMYATRIPAMQKLKIDAAKIKRKADLDALPPSVQHIADNYNHLHEQPTIYYALAFLAFLSPASDGMQIMLAWAYVGLRVVHSLLQMTVNFVPVRFALFALASLVLMAMTAIEAIALLR
jgi:hypothetical protein